MEPDSDRLDFASEERTDGGGSLRTFCGGTCRRPSCTVAWARTCGSTCRRRPRQVARAERACLWGETAIRYVWFAAIGCDVLQSVWSGQPYAPALGRAALRCAACQPATREGEAAGLHRIDSRDMGGLCQDAHALVVENKRRRVVQRERRGLSGRSRTARGVRPARPGRSRRFGAAAAGDRRGRARRVVGSSCDWGHWRKACEDDEQNSGGIPHDHSPWACREIHRARKVKGSSTIHLYHLGGIQYKR